MNASKTAVGQRIKRARLAIGFSQRKFATVLGTLPNHICQIEQGRCMPGSRLLHGMHVQFNIDINWLLTGQQQPFRLNSQEMGLRMLLHHYTRADETGKHLLCSAASLLATGEPLPDDAAERPPETEAMEQGELSDG